MKHDSIPDGATVYRGQVYTDHMDGIAADPRLSMHLDRGQLPTQIKDRIDIVDLIAQDIEVKRSGKDWQARCPFHQEKTPSFTVSREKQFYHCFGCGAHGDAFSWMQEYHHLSFGQALKALGRQAGVGVPRFIKGKDLKAAALSRDMTPTQVAQIEEALIHELYVVLQVLEAKQADRRLSGVMRKRLGDQCQQPDVGKRELQAVKRISSALEVLYP